MQRIARRVGKIAAWAVLGWGLAGAVARAEGITAFAASSLRDALGSVAEVYERETGVPVTLVFAASSTVSRQVASGAPADIVLLADQDWADWLVSQGTLSETTPFAGNRLVLIGVQAAPLHDLSALPAILGQGRLALAQVDAVPAGRYGKAALVSLGLWAELEPNIVQANNVRAALRFVERGEAQMAIGYASDLVALPALSALYEFDETDHPPIVYSSGAVTPQGADFAAFLLTATAQDRLAVWGFSPVAVTDD